LGKVSLNELFVEAMLTTGKMLIMLIVFNYLYRVVDLCCGLP